MFLNDTQTSILPKHTSNDLGGQTHIYASNQVGGKRRRSQKRQRKSRKGKKAQRRHTRKSHRR